MSKATANILNTLIPIPQKLRKSEGEFVITGMHTDVAEFAPAETLQAE